MESPGAVPGGGQDGHGSFVATPWDLIPILSRRDSYQGQIKDSDNMLTGGAISPPLEQIATPVTDVCPFSEKLKFG